MTSTLLASFKLGWPLHLDTVHDYNCLTFPCLSPSQKSLESSNRWMRLIPRLNLDPGHQDHRRPDLAPRSTGLSLSLSTMPLRSGGNQKNQKRKTIKGDSDINYFAIPVFSSRAVKGQQLLPNNTNLCKIPKSKNPKSHIIGQNGSTMSILLQLMHTELSSVNCSFIPYTWSDWTECCW